MGVTLHGCVEVGMDKSRLASKYFWIAIALIVYGIAGLFAGDGLDLTVAELVEKTDTLANILAGLAVMVLRHTAPKQTPLKPIVE